LFTTSRNSCRQLHDAVSKSRTTRSLELMTNCSPERLKVIERIPAPPPTRTVCLSTASAPIAASKTTMLPWLSPT